MVYACISDNRELLMNLQNKIEEELQGRDIWKSYTEERIRKMVETACGSGQKQDQLCGSTVCGQQSAVCLTTAG